MLRQYRHFIKIFLVNLIQISVVLGVPNTKGSGSRIVGGEQARVGQFPWAAAVTVYTSIGRHFCGGALMHHQWLLTAGQCVDGATLFSILLGTTKRDGNDTTVQRVATNLHYIHPEFDPLTLDNDIALIKFREELIYNGWIGVLYLPYFETRSGDVGSVFGWGQLNDSPAGLTDDLHFVFLTVMSQEECNIYYGNQLKENMFCAAGNYNEGICLVLGDSGSAISVGISHGFSAIFGLAIFTSGNGCESAEPSGFVKVYPYNDWLRNVSGGVMG